MRIAKQLNESKLKSKMARKEIEFSMESEGIDTVTRLDKAQRGYDRSNGAGEKEDLDSFDFSAPTKKEAAKKKAEATSTRTWKSKKHGL